MTTQSRELILAKAELESQRETRLAWLREVMRINPKHVLGRKPVIHLNGWLKLVVIGDQVCVFTCSKLFQEYAYNMRHHFVKLVSGAEAITFAADFIATRDHLPVRIDISRNISGIKFSEQLHKETITIVKSANLEMEAEVHLDEGIRGVPGESSLFVEKTKLGTGHKTSRIGREIVRELSSLIDPNGLDNYFYRWLVRQPGQLPQRIRIVYDEDERSKNLASRTVKAIEETAKELGVKKYVEIIQEQVVSDEQK